MNEVLNNIESCGQKLNLFNVKQARLGNQIRSFVKLNNLNINEIYYNISPLSETIIFKKLDMIVEAEHIIDPVEFLVNESKIKQYIALIFHAYIKDLYKVLVEKKVDDDYFTKKLLSRIKKVLKEEDFNIIIDFFFQTSKDAIKYKKETLNTKSVKDISEKWLFYFLLFIDQYDDSMRCFDKIYIKSASDILDTLRNLVINNNYISRKTIKELDNKIGIMLSVYDMKNEYDALKNSIKNYNSSFLKKEDIKPEILKTLPKQYEVKPIVKLPAMTREERIELYAAEKSNNNRYLDEECNFTSDEIGYIEAYVEMILAESVSSEFNIDEILGLLPYTEINNKIGMLNEIIKKLKLKNINSNTNKVLIKLNSLLKEDIAKKMQRKINVN